MKRITPNNITKLKQKEVFVFGSNSQGKHLGGAAKLAYEKFGSEWGISNGLTGHCYAIDSMSGIEILKDRIVEFITCAIENPSLVFLVTEIGCGIAGYTPEDIAPLFKECVNIENVFLPERFWEVLNK